MAVHGGARLQDGCLYSNRTVAISHNSGGGQEGLNAVHLRLILLLVVASGPPLTAGDVLRVRVKQQSLRRPPAVPTVPRDLPFTNGSS